MTEKFILDLRLKNQLLAGSNLKTPKDVVSYMGAMQAQDFNMVKWGIGVRLPQSTDKTIEEAINNGEIIRTHVLRPTWHLVTSDDIHDMLGLTAPRLLSSSKHRLKAIELPEDMLPKVRKIIIKALECGNYLTRENLAEVLTKNGIPSNTHRVGQIMYQLELECLICNGPIQQKKQTYALLEERVPKTKAFDKTEALKMIAEKYFSSHNPATIDDFAWWSGLSLTEARLATEMIKDNFAPTKIGSQTYWIANNSESALPIEDNSAHLLPAFDEFIISYKNRMEVLPDLSNHIKVIPSYGTFRPTIMKNGKVIGLWKKVTKKNKPTIETVFFKRTNKAMVNLVQAEVNKLELFYK